MELFIVIGSITLYIAGILTVGTLNFRHANWDRYTTKDERVAASLALGLFWGPIAGLAACVLPFLGLYYGAGAIISRDTRQEALAKRRVTHEREIAALEREVLPEHARMSYDDAYPRMRYTPDGYLRLRESDAYPAGEWERYSR